MVDHPDHREVQSKKVQYPHFYMFVVSFTRMQSIDHVPGGSSMVVLEEIWIYCAMKFGGGCMTDMLTDTYYNVYTMYM